MNKISRLNVLSLFVCIANLMIHLLMYPSLPDTIPIHWGPSNIADEFGPKYMDLVLAIIPFVIYLIIHLFVRIDPKHNNFKKFPTLWNGILLGFVCFIALISWLPSLFLYNILKDGSMTLSALIWGSLGFLFIILGNYMPKIRQNFSIGVRTPWALCDEHNWYRTQRMGGFSFIFMGILLIFLGIGSLVFSINGSIEIYVALVIILGFSLWIYLYSYLVFKGKIR